MHERLNMKKIISVVIAVVIVLSFFTGCQPNPSQDAVISKQNDIFEEKIEQTISVLDEKSSEQQSSLQWNDTFSSMDGSVFFTIDINQGVTKDTKQVIEVVPHPLSGEDIERVAKSLLGNVTFYERRPSQNTEYSKSQYQQMIERFAPYTNKDNLIALTGTDGYWEYIQKYIALWTQRLGSAPEIDPRIPCDWSLKKERHYNNNEFETEGRLLKDDADILIATAEKNGIEYNFSAISKNNGAYKVNRLNLNLTEGLGLYPVDMAIYRAMLCRTDAPTQAQIDEIVSKAMHMLEDMQLGHWYLYSTDIEEEKIGDANEYAINIVAAPTFYGDKVLLGQNLGASKADYAASYPATYAEFSFSANGDLLYFNLDSPVDVVETKNERVATLSITELMELCKQNLSYRDIGGFGLPLETIEYYENSYGEKILCNVKISEAKYGLGRRIVANSNDHYYYIPVLVLGGTAEYIGENSGLCYFSSNYISDENNSALVWINAVDGSIIQQ